ncbi:diguanylate cyclase [Vibrio sp. JCM 19236]|nr:diguanylate cyclase [Vibrio sp. JCM 19236]
MRISIKHALISILTLLVFFIGSLIFISDKQNRVREEIIEVGRQALDLSQKTHTLGMLVTDYSKSKSTDSLTRWLNTIDRVEKKYSALIQSSGLGDSVMIERVSSDITRIRTQFHLLQNVSGTKSYDWILSTLDTYNQNLIAHLDTLVRQVQEHSYDELEQLNLEQKLVVLSGILLLCLLFAVFYVSLVTPVRIISDAVNMTGINQDKRKYKSTRIYEWSVLQSKIEELLISLKQTTVSKTELEKEVQLRQLAEDTALQQAHTDFLTGLPNRRALSNMFKNRQIPSTSFGLLFIDMDNFKSINDNLGHEVGDKLLNT